MKLRDFQALFAQSFASAAENGTLTYPLPIAKTDAGRVSLAQGFPVETMTPIAAGGIPPHGADLNGVLRMLSLSSQRGECGLILPFSETFASNIGGYPRLALVTFGQGDQYWVSESDENQSVPGAENSQWRPLFADLVVSPTSQNADVRVRALSLLQTDVPDETVMMLETADGAVYEVPSVTCLKAKLAPLIESTRGGRQDRVIRVMRVNSVSDPRGAYVAVVDEDGATTSLASDLMALDIAQNAVQEATKNCVRTRRTSDEDHQITWLAGQDGADKKGPLMRVESDAPSPMQLPSVPYVQNMLTNGDGLPNLKDENGYVTLPGGFILQWGHYRTNKSDGIANVVFAKEFPTACVSVTLTEREAIGTWFNATPTVHGVRTAPTVTGFKAVTRLFMGNGQNVPHEATGSFMAIGY